MVTEVGAVFCARGFLFPRPADFRSATFSGRADFESATFSGFTLFQSATFSGRADFSSATFSGFAAFQSATFSDSAASGAPPSPAPPSSGAPPSPAPPTSGAPPSDYAAFESATFNGTPYFSDATFKSKTLFTNAVFRPITEADDGRPKNRTGFRSHARRCSSTRRCTRTPISPMSTGRRAGRCRPETRRDRAIAHRRAYERLKLLMDSQKKVADELMFQRLELRCREAETVGDWQQRDWWVARVSRLYGLLSDYGWDPVRPATGWPA